MDFKLKDDDLLDIGDKLTPEKFELEVATTQDTSVGAKPPVAEVISENVEEEVQQELDPNEVYSPSSMKADPKAMEIIREYMVDFRGMDPDTDKDKMFSEYMRVMRAFGNNTITSTNEARLYHSATEEQQYKAGAAYALFDQLGGVFSEEYTARENVGAIVRHGWEAIRDPINLVGLGIGKAITGGGAKVSAMALKELAVKSWKKQALELGVSKIKAEAIEKTIAKGGVQALSEADRLIYNQAKDLAVRNTLLTEAGQTAVKGAAKTVAGREVAAVTAVDAAAATGVELLRQDVMIDSGNQEELDKFSLGLAAASSVVLGGVGGYVGFKSNTKLAEKNAWDALAFVEPEAASGAGSAVSKSIANYVADTEDLSKTLEAAMSTGWDRKVINGQASNIEVVADTLNTMMLGDTTKGAKGIVSIMQEQGLTFEPRFPGDNLTNFTLDVIRDLPEEDTAVIVETIKDVAKKRDWEFTNPEGKVLDLDTMTIEDVTDMYAASISKGGAALNVMSQVSKLLRHSNNSLQEATEKQIKEAADDFLGWNKLHKESVEVPDRPEKIRAFQDTAIQFMVTHPGTTSANVVGSGIYMAADLASNVVSTLLYSGQGAAMLASGKGFNNVGFQRAFAQASSTLQMGKNLVRPAATMEELKTYGMYRPETWDKLMRYYAGGVDRGDLIKDYKLNPGDMSTQLFVKAEHVKEFAQDLAGTTLQDRFFKSQAFMYNLEKQMRLQYGKGYEELLEAKGPLMFQSLPEFDKVEAAALDATMKATFSKSYAGAFGNRNMVETVANGIEKVRTIPGFGMLMPFGRFWNNTIDFTADYSGAKVIMRLPGVRRAFNTNQEIADTDFMHGMFDAMAKGAVGWTALMALYEREKGNLEAGLGMFEEFGEGGTIVDTTYMWPYSAFKGAARLMSYANDTQDGAIPGDAWSEFWSVVGVDALTRTAESAADDLWRDIMGVLNGEEEVKDVITGLAGGIAQSYASAITRPLDPINEIVALATEGGPQELANRGNNWLKAVRYIDNLPVGKDFAEFVASKDPVTGEPVTRTAAAGDPVRDTVSTAVFGYRTVARTSATQKVFNKIGKPEWQFNVYDGPEEFNQRINAMLFDAIEPEAQRLMKSRKFLESPLAAREKMVGDMMSKAKATVKRQLRAAGPDVPDWFAPYYDFVNKHSDATLIREGLKMIDLPGDTDITTLTPSQFVRLDGAIQKYKKGFTGTKFWKEEEE